MHRVCKNIHQITFTLDSICRVVAVKQTYIETALKDNFPNCIHLFVCVVYVCVLCILTTRKRARGPRSTRRHFWNDERRDEVTAKKFFLSPERTVNWPLSR